MNYLFGIISIVSFIFAFGEKCHRSSSVRRAKNIYEIYEHESNKQDDDIFQNFAHRMDDDVLRRFYDE